MVNIIIYIIYALKMLDQILSDFFLRFSTAACGGHVELFENVLLLSAEMDDGLGLLVTTRPHSKTSADLFTRLSNVDAIWQAAAECKYVRMLEWLCKNAAGSCEDFEEVVLRASQCGRVDSLSFLAKHYLYVAKYFSSFELCFCCVYVCSCMRSFYNNQFLFLIYKFFFRSSYVLSDSQST